MTLIVLSSVCYRYDDFLTLHLELRSLFPTHKLPHLPKRKVLGRNETHTVAQQRMRVLQVYIQVSVHVYSAIADVNCHDQSSSGFGPPTWLIGRATNTSFT